MYARLVTVMIQRGNMDETVAMFRDSVVPALKEQEGFKGALLLTDRKAGKACAVVLWETEEDMLASETSGFYQDQIAKFAAVFAGPPIREHYGISVHV